MVVVGDRVGAEDLAIDTAFDVNLAHDVCISPRVLTRPIRRGRDSGSLCHGDERDRRPGGGGSRLAVPGPRLSGAPSAPFGKLRAT